MVNLTNSLLRFQLKDRMKPSTQVGSFKVVESPRGIESATFLFNLLSHSPQISKSLENQQIKVLVVYKNQNNSWTVQGIAFK